MTKLENQALQPKDNLPEPCLQTLLSVHCHAFELGAKGVQIASRFVATEECDASDAYKQAYIQAKAEDIEIVMSPVGMPGRALCRQFL